MSTQAPTKERDYEVTGGGQSNFSFMRIDTETGELVIGKDDSEFRMTYLVGYLDGFACKYNDNPGHAKIPKHWEYIFRITTKDPRDLAAAKAKGLDTKTVQPKEFALTLHSHWRGGLVPDALNSLLKKIDDPAWDRSFRMETWLKKREGNEPIPRCAFKEIDGTKWENYFPYDEETRSMPGTPMSKDANFEDFWLEKAKCIQAFYDKVNPSQVQKASAIPPTTTTSTTGAPKKTLGEKAISVMEKAWSEASMGDLATLVAAGKSTLNLLDTKYVADPELPAAKTALVARLNELITTNNLSSTAKFLADGTYDEFVSTPPPAEGDDLPF